MQNWLQCLFVVAIIFIRPLAGINVVAGFCAQNLVIKLIFAVLKQWLL